MVTHVHKTVTCIEISLLHNVPRSALFMAHCALASTHFNDKFYCDEYNVLLIMALSTSLLLLCFKCGRLADYRLLQAFKSSLIGCYCTRQKCHGSLSFDPSCSGRADQ